MHPEIVRDEPGSCPTCGMALEPKTVSAEEEETPELVDMTRPFKVSVVLTVPLVILAMGSLIRGKLKTVIGEVEVIISNSRWTQEKV